MHMRPFGFAELRRQSAFEPERGKLRSKFDNQYRIGKPAQRIRAIDTSGDEQKRQTRSQPQQEPEDIGPPALGQRCNIFLVLVLVRPRIRGCSTSRA